MPDGMPLYWYEHEVTRAQQALQAEYRRQLLEANLRADLLSRENADLREQIAKMGGKP